MAVSGTSCASHDSQALQSRCNDAGIEASASTNIRLASVDCCDDFPRPRVIGENDNIVRLDLVLRELCVAAG